MLTFRIVLFQWVKSYRERYHVPSLDTYDLLRATKKASQRIRALRVQRNAQKANKVSLFASQNLHGCHSAIVVKIDSFA